MPFSRLFVICFNWGKEGKQNFLFCFVSLISVLQADTRTLFHKPAVFNSWPLSQIIAVAKKERHFVFVVITQKKFEQNQNHISFQRSWLHGRYKISCELEIQNKQKNFIKMFSILACWAKLLLQPLHRIKCVFWKVIFLIFLKGFNHLEIWKKY